MTHGVNSCSSARRAQCHVRTARTTPLLTYSDCTRQQQCQPLSGGRASVHQYRVCTSADWASNQSRQQVVQLPQCLHHTATALRICAQMAPPPSPVQSHCGRQPPQGAANKEQTACSARRLGRLPGSITYASDRPRAPALASHPRAPSSPTTAKLAAHCMRKVSHVDVRDVRCLPLRTNSGPVGPGPGGRVQSVVELLPVAMCLSQVPF